MYNGEGPLWDKNVQMVQERMWERHGGSRRVEMKEGVRCEQCVEFEVRFKPPALKWMVAPIGRNPYRYCNDGHMYHIISNRDETCVTVLYEIDVV